MSPRVPRRASRRFPGVFHPESALCDVISSRLSLPDAVRGGGEGKHTHSAAQRGGGVNVHDSRHRKVNRKVHYERPFSERAVLPVLLPPLPRSHRRQAGLPAPRAHLRPPARPGRRRGPAGRLRPGPAVAGRRRRRGGEVEAAPDGPRRVPVLPAGAGHGRGLPHPLGPGQQSGLHVHPLRPRCQVHGALLPRQRGGPGPDEQLLHRPGDAHQLQHLLVRLRRLRRQHGQALREEPVRRHRRRLARATHPVRHQPGEHHPVRAEHRHRAHRGPGLALRVRRRRPPLAAHLGHAGGLPRHQEDLLLRRLPQHREGVQDHLPDADHPRHGGRGDRLLPRPGAVRALPQGGGAAVGGGRRPQRHRALLPVPGAPAPLHRAGAGGAAPLEAQQGAGGGGGGAPPPPPLRLSLSLSLTPPPPPFLGRWGVRRNRTHNPGL